MDQPRNLLRPAINVGLLAAFAALLAWSLTARMKMQKSFLNGSYYIILVLLAWWAARGCQYLRLRQVRLAQVTKHYGLGIVMALAMIVMVASSVPVGFKTLSDETNLVSVSRSMLENRDCRNVTMAANFYGRMHTLRYSIPQRPLAFPFLVHLYHLVSGYDYRNAFRLNLTVLFALLAGVYIIFFRLADRSTAIAAMLLILSTPLVPIFATSGGFDLLNSVFLLFILLLVFIRLNESRRVFFSFLWLSLVVFVNIRYESLLFAAAVVCLLAVMGRIDRPTLRACSLELCATPLFLLPTIWQRLLTIKFIGSFGSAAFSVSHLTAHAGAFFRGLLDFGFYLPFANLLLWGGILIYAFLVFWLAINRGSLTVRCKQFAVIFATLFGLNFGFYLAYFWGRYDHPATARLFLFVSIILAMGPLWLRLVKPAWLPGPRLLLVAVLLFVAYYPVAVKSDFIETLTLKRLTGQAMRYLAPYAKMDVMVVTERPGQYVAMGYGAVNFAYARKPAFRRAVERHLYPCVIVLQKIRYSDGLPVSRNRLAHGFSLTVKREVQISARYFLRISKLKYAARNGVSAGPAAFFPSHADGHLQALSGRMDGSLFFPEWRQAPQTLDDGGQFFDDVIDFGIGVVNAEAEAHRSVGRGERHPHGAQHVGRLQRTGGAGRSRRGADAVPVHQQQNGLALHGLKADIGGVGQTVLGIAVDGRCRNARQQAGFQPVPQFANARVLVVHVASGQLAGFAQRNDGGHVFRSPAAPAFLVPADQKGRKLGALADVEHADSLGGVEFVAGQREEIHFQRLQVDGHFAHGLHGIGVKDDSPGAHLAGDVCNGENHAGFIVGPHDTDDGRVRGQATVQEVGVQPSLGVHRHKGDAPAPVRQMLAEVFHGRMLDPRGDNVAFFGLGVDRGPDGRTVAFGAAAGKHDLFGLCTQQSGDPLAGFFELLADFAGEAVHARRIGVQVLQVGQHFFEDFRCNPRGGIVVKVDTLHRQTSSTTNSGTTSSRSFFST